MYAVEIEGIRHTYPAGRKTPARVALKGIDLSIDKGEMFGFLGPNGSGKTTLFKILSTLIAPTEGTARILGVDITSRVSEARKSIGVVFQHPSLDRKLTVEENLLHQGHLYGMAGSELKNRITAQLERFDLAGRRREPVEQLSGGLMRRVELAKGLIHKPDVMILDEPSTGLDPGARKGLRETLDMLRKQEGVTVLLTTHLAEEADYCDRLAIMNEGEIAVIGGPEELKHEIGGDIITIVSDSPEELAGRIREKGWGEPMLVEEGVRVEMENGHEFIPRLVEAFPGLITAITLGKPTLQDVFVHQAGRSFYGAGTGDENE